MNVTSKPISVKASALHLYINKDFNGTLGQSDETGGFSFVCNPEVMEQELKHDTDIPGVLTIVQWDAEIPLSNGMQFTIDSIVDKSKITVEQALAVLKGLISRKNK